MLTDEVWLLRDHIRSIAQIVRTQSDRQTDGRTRTRADRETRRERERERQTQRRTGLYRKRALSVTRRCKKRHDAVKEIDRSAPRSVGRWMDALSPQV